MSRAVPASDRVAAWLDYQLALHPQEIELGLERVAAVGRALGVLPWSAASVLIAGTNGKGSCAALVAALVGRRKRVGVYTSPHLWRYNERICIDGDMASDAELVEAFGAVEAARESTALTYFEFGTLAALWLFRRAGVELAVLEVGLGGRLDAVNIVDADVALITPIGLDHTDWLGPDREHIGFEKAGIMRAGRPALCGDRGMPASVARHAANIGAPLAVIGRDFDIAAHRGRWVISGLNKTVQCAIHPNVLPDNLALSAAGVQALDQPLDCADLERACDMQANLVGRREFVDGHPPIVYDVGHNVEAAAVLAAELMRRPVAGTTRIVFGMLADKPVEEVHEQLAGLGAVFYPAGLDSANARGLSGPALAQRIGATGPTFANPADALAAAQRASSDGDRIVVCGSFHTVAGARAPAEKSLVESPERHGFSEMDCR